MKLYEITQLNSWHAFQDVLFQRKKLWTYGMQYWYFKLTDLYDKRIVSYILIKNKIETVLNNKTYCLQDNEYLQVETVFSAQKQDITTVEPIWDKNILTTPSFSFSLDHDGLSLIYQEEKIVFNTVSVDSYRANIFNIYQGYSLNTYNSRYYVTLQNITKQGVLGPWHWLHLYLEDGTYINLFLIMGVFNRVMWIGRQIWRLETADYRDDRVVYKAIKQNMFFCIELKKKYIADLVYRPKFSPAWSYSQAEVSVEAVKRMSQNFRMWRVVWVSWS